MSCKWFRIAVALVVALVPGMAFAQTGSLTGLVRDSSGAAVPGATVRVIAEKSRATVEVVTNEQGAYRAEGLVPGPYRLETTLDGFETSVRRLVLEAGQTAALDVTLAPSQVTEGVVVTARRIEEAAQEVPIPVSVVSGDLIESAGAFNVNRLKDLIPTVQFYSTNPRNSAVNIRGLGAPFGLTNDGIEPGVGLYIDGVFYARPAAATLDFLDVERIEVLRGPQGTLFGKNTTAGAINVTTRRPSFTRAGRLRAQLRQLRFRAGEGIGLGTSSAKGCRPAVVLRHAARRHGPQHQDTAGRERSRQSRSCAVSCCRAVGQARDHGDRGPHAPAAGRLHAGGRRASRRRCATPNRQYPQIAADLGLHPAELQRLRSPDRRRFAAAVLPGLGGASLTVDWNLGPGRLTSTTAWRYWDWNPSNDRDFIGLPVTTVSAAPSKQRQWTQEVRYAGGLTPRLNLVAGAFAFHQTLDSNPSFKQEQGAAAARFLLAPSAAAADARAARWLRLRSVRHVRECQRGASSASWHGRSPIACACCPACASTTTRRK